MKGIVLVPTYKESGNICRLMDEILRQGLDLDILVVDDNSPDGTAHLVQERANKDPRIHLMVRKGIRGRGAAGIDGFREAIKFPVDYVVEMDADFSHEPSFIPRFLPALENADVVIASRLVPGGGDPGRGIVRKALTKLANGWIRFWLGISTADATAGFRCFRRSVLVKLDWDKMVSAGPSVIEETLLALHQLGARIVEIPFVFKPRAAGKSQLNLWKVLHTFCMVTYLRLRKPPIKSPL